MSNDHDYIPQTMSAIKNRLQFTKTRYAKMSLKMGMYKIIA